MLYHVSRDPVNSSSCFHGAEKLINWSAIGKLKKTQKKKKKSLQRHGMILAMENEKEAYKCSIFVA